jgi:ABC-type glycerol-3-phosphate transport system substrate-binding protein
MVIGMFLFALTASVWAGGGQAKTATTQTTTTPASGLNLSGMNVVIGNWWGDWDTATLKPGNADEERTFEWRSKIQKDNNFKMREANIADWGEMQELVSTSIMSGSPAASIFVLQPNWTLALYNQSLLYPISDCTSVDFSSTSPVEWNQVVKDTFTFGGKTYAFQVGYGGSQHGNGVYFNKRLFQEAGINPNLPYDMQKAGTWTWDAFLDLCKRLTRDTNNDGITDIYAIATFPNDPLDAIIGSNGAHYVDKDASGKFVNATGRPEFLQALQFAVRLNREGVLMSQPEGSEWNWFQSMFHDGRAAMRVAPQYTAGDLGDMADDWGFVLFPKGPSVSDYRFNEDEVVMAIPRTVSPEEANKILYAYSLWASPASGNDGPDAWKAAQYTRYRDARAVDETLAMMRDPSRSMMKYIALIPGMDNGSFAGEMWNEGVDPAQLIESVSQSWNSIISEANRIK